jgi:lysophospholipase L1-like esterase
MERVLTKFTANPKDTEPSPKSLVPAVSKKRFSENIRYMVEQSQRHGAMAVVLSLCSPPQYARAAEKASRERGSLYLNGQGILLSKISSLPTDPQFQDRIRLLSQELHSQNAYDPLLLISSDGCHPNEIGHKIVGNQLASIIATSLEAKS